MSDIDPPLDTSKIVEEVLSKVSESVPESVKSAVEEQVKSAITEVTPSITEALRKDIIGNITSSLTGKTEDPNAPPWVRENRNPTNYVEVAEWGKQQALREIEAREATRKAEDEKNRSTEDNTRLAKEKALADSWNSQIDSLTKSEYIPAPVEEIIAKLTKGEKLTDDELKDPGVEARRELFRVANEHKETNLELAYYKYYLPEHQNKISGEDAPVIGKVKTSNGGSGGLSYEELHGMPMNEVAIV